MKTLYLFFVTILINMMTLHVAAQNRKTYSGYMQFSITVLHRSLPTNNYSVVLYKHGVKVDSVFNTQFSSIDFILQTNQVYSFVFKKAGCENSEVFIDTLIPEGSKSPSSKTKTILVNMLSKANNQIPSDEDLDDAKHLLISYETCVNSKNSQR